jgi:hypothetical protein
MHAPEELETVFRYASGVYQATYAGHDISGICSAAHLHSAQIGDIVSESVAEHFPSSIATCAYGDARARAGKDLLS